ncbi:MAG: DUF547 domain-containing protein [Cryomorphaceae bacterium]|nr:MAG: DUF547 domain-containing protein [Cryomorphaceae bacterium]
MKERRMVVEWPELPGKVLLVMLWMVASSCQSQPEFRSEPITHEAFTGFLRQYVDGDGMVNYRAMQKDSTSLNKYLATLESHHPHTGKWSKAEQLAYWINAYNAFTLQLVLRHYPVESIKDLGGWIYRVNTTWDIRFIEIEGQRYHLNDIEHNIIRKQFDEPRIHFALVCAARSCPRLRNEAYEAHRLEEQLEDQTRHFFNSWRNELKEEALKLSKLLKWYSGDFKNHGGVRVFVERYGAVSVSPDARIEYLEYDWKLNEQ